VTEPVPRATYVIAAAILAGSGLIALGLYLGLRARAPAAPRPTPPAVPSVPVKVPVKPPPPSPAEMTARVQRDAVAALDAQRATLIDACWTPIVAKAPDPPSASFVLVVSFDPQGHENGRGVTEPRGTSRHDVAVCLGEQPFSLAVPAPGMQVTVELPITLP
jgi:hypothetical protein